jgi:hypothetical protein
MISCSKTSAPLCVGMRWLKVTVHTLSTCVWSFFLMVMTPSRINKEWQAKNIKCMWQQDLWLMFSYSRPGSREKGVSTEQNVVNIPQGRVYTGHLTPRCRADSRLVCRKSL